MKSKLSASEGTVTILIVLILVPALVTAGIMVDMSRFYTAQQIVSCAGDLALDSALANYNGLLKETYGLFAISPTKASRDIIANSFCTTLNVGESNLFKFTDIKLEVENLLDANLANPEVLKKQIVDYMKYRSPLRLVEKLFAEGGELANLSEENALHSKDLSIGLHLANTNTLYRQLFRLMLKQDEFNIERERDFYAKANSSFTKIFNNFQTVFDMKQLLAVNSISQREEVTTSSQGIEQAIQVINQTAQGLHKNVAKEIELNSKTLKVINDIETLLDEINSSTQAARELMQDLANDIEKIKLMGKQENHINYLARQLSAYRLMIIDGDISIISNFLDANKRHVDASIKQFESLRFTLQSLGGLNSSSISHYQQVIQKLHEYENLEIQDDRNYNYFALSADTGVGEIYATLQEWFQPLRGDVGLFTKAQQLFTQNCVFETEHRENPQEIPVKLYNQLSANNNLLDPAEIELEYPTDADAAEAGKSILDNIKNLFEGIGSELSNKIFLQQYALGMFTCHTINNSDKTNYLTNMPYLPQINYLYGSEVEYLLFGRRNADVNTALAKSMIFCLRFALNYRYIISDVQLMTAIESIALAAASLLPVTLPIIKTTILLSVVAAETTCDISKLYDGEAVSLMKSPESWQIGPQTIKKYLDGEGLSLPATKVTTQNEITFTYKDYLGLLLLTSNQDKLLGRIGSLIELNMSTMLVAPAQNTELETLSFRTAEAKTAVKLKAHIEVDYLFIDLLSFDQLIIENELMGQGINYNNYRGY